ncbi:MAG: cytochrome C [Methylococcaceae bacterium]
MIQRPYLAIASTLLAVIGLLFAEVSNAIPSFARQTGVACSACHTNSFGPNLTPFGRTFKLKGYTMGGDGGGIPPISAMAMGSFTHTDKDQGGGHVGGSGSPSFGANNNFAFDEASLFYGGRVAGPVGAFAQITYNGVEGKLEMDNTDIRAAGDTQVFGQSLTYGVSLNNNPTVQDLWNSTPAWGFPFVGSSVSPTPGAGLLIDDGLAQQVGGATAYALISDLLFVEAGAYASLAKDMQQFWGSWSQDNAKLNGPAPYWRIALQHEWDGQYLALGTYGLKADMLPGRVQGVGLDRYTDLGADLTYQYLGSMEHIFEARATYLRETQELNGSRNLGGALRRSGMLNTFRINGSYTYLQTYSASLGYFDVSGTRDSLLYADYAAFRPDSQGLTAELDYVPFGKSDSLMQPWLNLRLALQYVGYAQFDGSSKKSSDNNTFYLNSWISF